MRGVKITDYKALFCQPPPQGESRCASGNKILQVKSHVNKAPREAIFNFHPLAAAGRPPLTRLTHSDSHTPPWLRERARAKIHFHYYGFACRPRVWFVIINPLRALGIYIRGMRKVFSPTRPAVSCLVIITIYVCARTERGLLERRAPPRAPSP